MKIQFQRRILSGIAIPAVSLPLLYSFSSWGTSPALATAYPTPARGDGAAVLAADPESDPLAGLDDISASEPVDLRIGTAEVVIQSSGAIEADVDRFRALLGDPNNGAIAGQQDSGRREINWDAVPAAVTNVPNFPPEFFNINSTRGLAYDALSPGLEVSDQRFADINPTYAAEFTPFSGQKLFSPIGSNTAEATFFVAGSAVKSPVRGFGVVFSDVDVAGSTGIVLFSEEGRKLGRIRAPVRTDARGASFVGVVFRNPVIGRVLIVSGNGALSPLEKDVSQGGLHDLVVMDDFLYGEPTATH